MKTSIRIQRGTAALAACAALMTLFPIGCSDDTEPVATGPTSTASGTGGAGGEGGSKGEGGAGGEGGSKGEGGAGGEGGSADVPGLNQGAFKEGMLWDVQRDPVYPKANEPFKVSGFASPLADNGQPVVFAAGDTIRFEFVGGACTDPHDVKEVQYDSSNKEKAVLSPGGKIWGLGAEGFFYESKNGFGTFISNGTVYKANDSLTYTPKTGEAKCAELKAYEASK